MTKEQHDQVKVGDHIWGIDTSGEMHAYCKAEKHGYYVADNWEGIIPYEEIEFVSIIEKPLIP